VGAWVNSTRAAGSGVPVTWAPNTEAFSRIAPAPMRRKRSAFDRNARRSPREMRAKVVSGSWIGSRLPTTRSSPQSKRTAHSEFKRGLTGRDCQSLPGRIREPKGKRMAQSAVQKLSRLSANASRKRVTPSLGKQSEPLVVEPGHSLSDPVLHVHKF
jgi:hypothetical protein